MCLIVFDWRPDVPASAARSAGQARLTLAANRDEFWARPAAPMNWWDDAPQILAGRDLQGGGTWLGVHRDGRFAALTNYRAASDKDLAGPTRGTLVADFLKDQPRTPLAYLEQVAARPTSGPAAMRGFNLLAGNLLAGELAYFGNRTGQPPRLLEAGCYGLSNAALDTPWPKVVAQTAALRDVLAAGPEQRLTQTAVDARLAALLALMHDTRQADDNALPSTGLTLDWERALSAAWIELPNYGTRCTTALHCAVDGTIDVIERGDSAPDGRRLGAGARDSRFRFTLTAAPHSQIG